MKHTPGPWEIVEDFNIPTNPADSVCSIRSRDYYVAEICGDVGHFDSGQETAEANARLICAAPELLEVARLMVADDAFAELCAGIGEEPEWLKKARIAIAKAEGQ